MRPEYLLQGERATLFPVLATTSKEGDVVFDKPAYGAGIKKT